MRVRNFASLFLKINEHFRKSRCLPPHQSLLITLHRHFSQWDLVGAVCLERKPIITQALNPLEERYSNYIQKLEVEKSYLSDHEKRQIVEKQIEQKLKAGTLEDMDMVVKQTAQDFEDACSEEFKKYKPASRMTDADVKNDRQSIQRKLDSSLVLVVNEKLGNEFKWVLPQTSHKDGETLRQTAERALQQVANCNGSIQFMGNAPVGYYKYKYPKVVRGNGIIGAKVFFFKAVLLCSKEDSVVIKKSDNLKDFLWLTHSELEEVLLPVLCKTVQSFLFPDILIRDTHDEDSVQTDEEEQLSEKRVIQH